MISYAARPLKSAISSIFPIQNKGHTGKNLSNFIYTITGLCGGTCTTIESDAMTSQPIATCVRHFRR